MKKVLFIMFATLLGLNSFVFAKEASVINGNSHLDKGRYDALQVNGNLTFTDLEITNGLVINGNLQGKNLKSATIVSNGPINVEGLQVQSVNNKGYFVGKSIDISGEAVFNGDVEIEGGRLNSIKITGTNPTLINTQVNGNIDIKKTNSGWSFLGLSFGKSVMQVLTLKGNSLIVGDITFEKEGEIQLIDGAKIAGKVINAKVVQK